MGSALTSVRSSSENNSGTKSGLLTVLSSWYSSTIPPSRHSSLRAFVSPEPARGPHAPTIARRTSEPLLPPSTGRPLTSTTVAPVRAAAKAALVPALPPPATNTSTSSVFSINPAPQTASRGPSPSSRCRVCASTLRAYSGPQLSPRSMPSHQPAPRTTGERIAIIRHHAFILCFVFLLFVSFTSSLRVRALVCSHCHQESL